MIEYAPKEQGFKHIVASRTGRQRDLRRRARPPEMAAAYTDSAGPALSALREFNTFQLFKKTSDGRLGVEEYAKRFKLADWKDATPGPRRRALANLDPDWSSMDGFACPFPSVSGIGVTIKVW